MVYTDAAILLSDNTSKSVYGKIFYFFNDLFTHPDTFMAEDGLSSQKGLFDLNGSWMDGCMDDVWMIDGWING